MKQLARGGIVKNPPVLEHERGTESIVDNKTYERLNKRKASANRAMKPATEAQAKRHSDKEVKYNGYTVPARMKKLAKAQTVRPFPTTPPVAPAPISAHMLNDAYETATALNAAAVRNAKKAQELLSGAQGEDVKQTVRKNRAARSWRRFLPERFR